MVANPEDSRNSDLFPKKEKVKWADKVKNKEKTAQKASDNVSKEDAASSEKAVSFGHRLLLNSRYDSEDETSISM